MKSWKKGFVKESFFVVFFFPPYFTFRIWDLSTGQEAEVSSSMSSGGSETREKGVDNAGWGRSKTGSFDNSWLEPSRVSLWVFSWRKLQATLGWFPHLSHLKGESVNAHNGWLCATVQIHTHLLIIRNRLLGLLQAKAERTPTLFLLFLQHPNNFPSVRASN